MAADALNKGYDPSNVERKWYETWMEKGYFHADETDDKEPYTIVIPLPNVTGHLHMGHALMVSIQDLLIRWKRMEGYSALWMPGTDHAGIATQMVVERDLALNGGKTRQELGRETFLEKVWEWKEAKGGRIIDQLKELGASLDWDRTRFTMDEICSRAVTESFVRLYDEGLIYRGWRMVNLSPKLQTIVSDLEVEYEENSKGELWSFAYPVADGSGEIVVATTRPETMLGDTAVAVHPDDDRYKHLIGKTLKHPLMDYELPIVGDAILVDPEFGTGAVKVTPGHDPNDFETGKRHNLEVINLLNMDGTFNSNAGPYEGLDVMEARKKVKEDLEAKGLFRGTKEHMMNVGRCQRSGGVIEPYVSRQWFVKAKPLAEPAIKAVESGETKFVPKNWEKTYYEWMYNIHDWCISRQLWWGHRIPAWYCDDCDHVTVSRETPEVCGGCGGTHLHQDEDVLDTWFSSALWPFSTMSWPDETTSLNKYYPTDVMETGFDIIFFWVARMMMMGIHFMDKPPFHTVYLHAMVRDHEGHKMSKVKGNVIDPLDVIYGIGFDDLMAKRRQDAVSVGLTEGKIKGIEKSTRKEFKDGIPASGADALRFSLISMAGHGRDIKLDIKRVEGFRFFANKIWNASRFIMMNLDDFDASKPVDPDTLGLADKWVLYRLSQTVEGVKTALDGYYFDQAAMTIYHFFWNEFCDWYIELCKPTLYGKVGGGAEHRHAAQHTLVTCLDTALKLLHPIMPFITEEIWQKLPKLKDEPESIMISRFPTVEDLAHARAFDEDAAKMERLMEVVKTVRNIRGESNLEPGLKIPVVAVCHDDSLAALIGEQEHFIKELARVEPLQIAKEYASKGPVASGVCNDAELFVPLGDLIDVEEEKNRIQRQIEKAAKDLEKVENKLGNENFISRAPEEVVQKERDRQEELRFILEKLKKNLAELG